MMETIPIPLHEFNFCTMSKDSYCGNFNSRVNELIKNSTSLFDKKSKLIMKELQNLKSDYLSQLHCLSDFLNMNKNNTKSYKTVPKPQENSIIRRCVEKEKKILYEETKNIPLSAATKASYLDNFKEVSANNSINNKKKLNTLTGFNNTNNKKTIEINNSIISTNNNSINKKTNSPSPFIKLLHKGNNFNTNCDKSPVKKNINKGAYNSADRKTSNRLNLNLNEFLDKPCIVKDDLIPEFVSKLKNEIMNEKIPAVEHKKARRFDIQDEREFYLNDTNTYAYNNLIEVNHSANLSFEKKIIKTKRNDRMEKFYKAFKILAKSQIVNLKGRIIFSSLYNKSGVGVIDSKEIIQDYYYLIKQSIYNLQKELRENKIDEFLLNKISYPSKTAQNGLNFLTKQVESSFVSSQCEEVTNILRIIFILLNENYENLDENNLKEFLIKDIFSKYQTENLKSLFLDHIYTKVFINHTISSRQINKFNEIIEKMPHLIKPSQISKSNQGSIYISFSLKEIHDYINLQKLKTHNKEFLAPILASKWRLKFHSLNKFVIQEGKLKKFFQ